MYMQDNKAAYATLTVALYNWDIKHYCTSRTHYKNSSGDEIANMNFFYNIAHVEASAYAH